MDKNKLMRKGFAVVIILFLSTVNIIPFTIGVQENAKSNGIVDKISRSDVVDTMENKGMLKRDIVTMLKGKSYFSYFVSDTIHPSDEITYGITTNFEKMEPTNFSHAGMTNNTRTITSEGGEHFYGQSNNSIFIVKVTSPNTIYFEDIIYKRYIGVIGEQTSSLEYFTGIFFTNMTLAGVLLGGSVLYAQGGSLRYKQFRLGHFINKVYDNRTLYTLNNQTVYCDTMENGPITLTPGSWYFIFTSNIFDLDQEDQSTNISVWMNFTQECNDINISTSEGGIVYGLWYGEYNANIVISKALTSELIMNGKTHFHINNTFIYQFVVFPWQIGYWNLRWNTPQERMTYYEHRTENKTYYAKNNVDVCWHGIGGPGDYTLRIGSYDSNPNFWAMMPYFLGLDVKLS